MDDKTKARIERLGLKVSQFEGDSVAQSDKVRALEDAVIELASIISTEEEEE